MSINAPLSNSVVRQTSVADLKQSAPSTNTETSSVKFGGHEWKVEKSDLPMTQTAREKLDQSLSLYIGEHRTDTEVDKLVNYSEAREGIVLKKAEHAETQATQILEKAQKLSRVTSPIANVPILKVIAAKINGLINKSKIKGLERQAANLQQQSADWKAEAQSMKKMNQTLQNFRNPLPSSELKDDKNFVVHLLPKELYNYDDTGNVDPLSKDILQEIGSKHIHTNENGTVSVSHDSSGDQVEKNDKAGRNCDRVIAGEKNGAVIIGIFDGSGAKAAAMKTAAACAEHATKVLVHEDGFQNASSPEECKSQASKLFNDSVDPQANPAIRKAMGFNKDGTRTTGSTTAITLRVESKDDQMEIKGGAVGDCVGFILNKDGCQELFLCDGLKGEVKDVTDAGGQLSCPSGDQIRGSITSEDSIKGIYKKCDKDSQVIVGSDGLSDNLNTEDMSNVVHFIAYSPAFNEIPEKPPSSQFDLQTLQLPNFEMVNGNLQFAKSDSVGDPPHKPTSEDLKKQFGENDHSTLPTNEQIATRLNNYTKWITNGLLKNNEQNMQMSTFQKILNVVPMPEGGSKEELTGLLKDGIEVKLPKKNDGSSPSPNELDQSQLKNVLNSLDSPEFAKYEPLVPLMKLFCDPKVKLQAIAEGVIKESQGDANVLNEPDRKKALYLLKHDTERHEGLTGKYDDITIVVASLKGQN